MAIHISSDYDIPLEYLTIDKKRILGSGEFCDVFYGIVNVSEYLDQEEKTQIEVAVRVSKPELEISYWKTVLAEIKIMAALGRHENLVSFLGTVTTDIRNCEVYMVTEYCAKDDLLSQLRKQRNDFVDLWNPKSSPQMSTLDLLHWSIQVASGMAYMTEKKIIHGDLAARNVLLSAKNVAKICNFELSVQLNDDPYYIRTEKILLPWKWLAIESLTEMCFSIKSDVWAFGVTLWEIFTLGKIPYDGKNWDVAFMGELAAGLRLESPQYGNVEIFNLMLNCMAKEPEERMTFLEIKNKLEKIKASLTSVVLWKECLERLTIHSSK